jgi:hypothetical protein
LSGLFKDEEKVIVTFADLSKVQRVTYDELRTRFKIRVFPVTQESYCNWAKPWNQQKLYPEARCFIKCIDQLIKAGELVKGDGRKEVLELLESIASEE